MDRLRDVFGGTFLATSGESNLVDEAFVRQAILEPNGYSGKRLKERTHELLGELTPESDLVLVDFHAEATSEKIAMGYHLDGRASCCFGTHTHVVTADECILPKGTAYITDVGMTGAHDSVLGRKSASVLKAFRTQMPVPFEIATGRKAIVMGKPQPLLFEMAMQRLGADPADCIMIGDRPDTDILGAQRLGLRTALVRTGRFAPGEPLPDGVMNPDWDVDSLAELETLFTNSI